MTQTLTSVATLMPEFYDRLLLDSLYPNLYLYQLGEKRRIPRGWGKVVHWTRYFKSTGGSGHDVPFFITEGTAIGLSNLSAAQVSATLSGFGSAIGVSDFIVMTGISDVVSQSVFELSKGMALAIERKTRAIISGTGTILPATGIPTANSSLIGTASTINANDIMRAVARLRQDDARAWPDGQFVALTHPRVAFDIRNDATATQAWTDVNRATVSGQEKIYHGEVGRLYGARVIETTEAKQLLPTTASLFKISAGASGFVTTLIAPGAYGVAELDGQSASVFVKQVGSAGSLDSINQKGSIGVKAYFAPAVLEGTRLKRIPSGGQKL